MHVHLVNGIALSVFLNECSSVFVFKFPYTDCALCFLELLFFPTNERITSLSVGFLQHFALLSIKKSVISYRELEDVFVPLGALRITWNAF